MKENNRIAFIDRMKGLAIILVVVGHLLKTGEDGIVYQFIYSFHMPLFMFLSGIVVKDSIPIMKLARKLSQFLWPFIVVGSLYVLFIGNTIADFVLANKKMGYWYLLVLAIFYVFASIYGLLGKKHIVKDIFLSVGIYFLFRFACVYLPRDVVGGFSLDVCYQNWPFFVLGLLVHRYDLLYIMKKYNIIFSIALIAYIPSYYVWIKYGHLYVVEAMLAIMILYYFFMVRDKSQMWIERKLSYIGKKTLDIYIYHCFVTQYIAMGCLNLYLEETNNILIEFILSLMVALIVVFISIAIGKIIRKSDILKVLVYGFNGK